MKRQIICILAALLFSTFFYQQDLGLNMLLFAGLSITTVFYLNPQLRHRKDLYGLALVYALSASFVFFNNSALSIGTTFVAFLIFIGAVSARSNSVYVQWINGIYQAIIGQLHQSIHRSQSASAHPTRTHRKYDVKFIVLTLLLVIISIGIFGSLYSQANPVFAKGFEKIDLSFINLYWVIFTLMGYLLMLNCTATAQLEALVVLENRSPRFLTRPVFTSTIIQKLSKEYRLAQIVIIALLILIALYIAADIYVILAFEPTKGYEFSQAVHSGITALITSIILAIVVILIFFRAHLNFYKKNKGLKTLTYLWLFFNLGIVGLTIYKNLLYCAAFGLTYKRIGVYIYLLLSAIGLITTFFKILNKETVYHLIRTNARMAFFVLLLISSFSWDRVITRYNLTQIDQPDMSYLLSLSRSNSDLLYAYAKDNPAQINDPDRINIRYYYYLRELSRASWQSLTLRAITTKKQYETVENKISEYYTL